MQAGDHPHFCTGDKDILGRPALAAGPIHFRPEEEKRLQSRVRVVLDEYRGW